MMFGSVLGARTDEENADKEPGTILEPDRHPITDEIADLIRRPSVRHGERLDSFLRAVVPQGNLWPLRGFCGVWSSWVEKV